MEEWGAGLPNFLSSKHILRRNFYTYGCVTWRKSEAFAESLLRVAGCEAFGAIFLSLQITVKVPYTRADSYDPPAAYLCTEIGYAHLKSDRLDTLVVHLPGDKFQFGPAGRWLNFWVVAGMVLGDSPSGIFACRDKFLRHVFQYNMVKVSGVCVSLIMSQRYGSHCSIKCISKTKLVRRLKMSNGFDFLNHFLATSYNTIKSH